MQTKRVMILGATGSLGGYLLDKFRSKYAVFCPQPRRRQPLVQGPTWLSAPLDIQDSSSLGHLLHEAKPDVIVNCAAIIPRSHSASNERLCEEVNGLFPHRLAEAATTSGAYVIHISTDGVFSGVRGNYSERDIPDPQDLYGRTKLQGELHAQHCLTLRTTFFGAFHTGLGLVNWYLQQATGPVNGYSNYRFSPVSAKRLAQGIEQLIDLDNRPYGVYHAGGKRTTKLELLQIIQETIGRPGEIRSVETPVCDRSLDSARFWNMLGQAVPRASEMVKLIESELQDASHAQRCA